MRMSEPENHNVCRKVCHPENCARSTDKPKCIGGVGASHDPDDSAGRQWPLTSGDSEPLTFPYWPAAACRRALLAPTFPRLLWNTHFSYGLTLLAAAR
jgi:hypothetical protein